MYNATITTDIDPKLIEKCFAPEDKQIKGKASYTVKRNSNNIVFEIKAKDSIALRTATNSITKMLTVIEKMRSIK